MKIIADTHCHTVASTHAYSTLLENVSAAAEMGLYAIAITDHAKTMPGAPGRWYFENMRVVPRKLKGVFVLKGVEANVLDEKGTVDITESESMYLDWMIASMHEPVTHLLDDRDACTSAWMNIAKNPRIQVIGHSGTAPFAYDYEKVIPEFGRNGKVVEINNASFLTRQKSISNCKKIAELCKKFEVPVILNSDAHFCTQIGHAEHAAAMLQEILFPEELIINANVDRFCEYLEKNTSFFKHK